ncbi:hypothetical protein JCM21900_003205 [Sporobolomyces salmonicolor]
MGTPRPLSTERRNSSTSRRPLNLSGSASSIPKLNVKRTGEAVEPDDSEPCAGGGAGVVGGVGGGSGSSAMAMQCALSSDKFVRRSRDKRRNRQPETTGRENAVPPALLSGSNPSRPASPLLCSPSSSRPNSPVLHHYPRVPRSSAHAPSSLSAQHPSRSRSRHSLRTSPRLAAQLALPARQLSLLPLPSPALSANPSACPEPRGSTLSLPHPNAARTEMSDVLASGEIGVGEERGKLEELLVELRDARSAPASECGDNDQEEDQILEPYIPQMPPNVHDCTLPLPIPDLPPTEPSPSPEVSMLPSPLSSPSPSARQYLPLPPQGLRRVSGTSTHSTPSQRDSGLSTSPQQRGRGPKPPLAGLGLAEPCVPSAASTAAGEKRRRDRTPGGSLSVPLPSSHANPAQSCPSTINPARPPLTTYTSFEDAFGLRPPSPPASPAAEEGAEGGREGGRKWWRLA